MFRLPDRRQARIRSSVPVGWPFRAGVGELEGLRTPADVSTDYLTAAGSAWINFIDGHYEATGSDITSAEDQFGFRDFVSGTAKPQVLGNVAAWPNTANNVYMRPASAFSPKYAFLIMRYKDGLDAAFDDFDSIIAAPTGETFRVIGDTNDPFLFAGWQTEVTKNGVDITSGNILPTGWAIIELIGPGGSAQWGLGQSNNGSTVRGAKGAFAEAVFYTEVPDTATREWLTGTYGPAQVAKINESGLADALLLESGDTMLLESGDRILLE